MVGFLVIFTAFFQWLSGFIIITWMTSIYSSKVSFTDGEEEGSLSFQGSISRNAKQVFAIFRSGFHQAHFLMRTLEGKILHGALRQSNGSIPLASVGITLCLLGAWLHPNLPQPSHSSAPSAGQNEGPARCSFPSSLTTGKHNWQGMENEQKWLLLTSGKQEC